MPLKSPKILEKANRCSISYPTPCNDDVIVGTHVHRHVLACGTAQCGWMDKANMCGINKVFCHVQIMCFNMQGTALMGLPRRIGKLGQIKNVIRICLVWVSHPDPNNLMLFVQGVSLNIGRSRKIVLTRDTDAFAVAAKCHAVVTALNGVTDALAF